MIAELVGGPWCGTTLTPHVEEKVVATHPTGQYERTGKMFSDGSREFRWKPAVEDVTQADGGS